ncbi:hypothetical protein B0T17DRAFT_618716 [Bombardia bombarda]|uniref:CFEM domain-containing protein n=1 Tax=Bombardia bombarda TaxID=252184 RepID=A0AA39WMD9_9PEZI|nr:hypothetical protein B0T17DRAFT_618716 [Bombardia bombarda]
MKLSPVHLIGVFFVAGVQSQFTGCTAVAVTAIPSCAQSCFIDNAPSVGCGGFDFACQCEKEASFYAAIEGCVDSSCPSSVHQGVIDGASSVCECATGIAAGGSVGSMTASGTVSGIPPPTGSLPPATSAGSGTVIPPMTSSTSPGSGESEGFPTTSPSFFAKASDVSATHHQAGFSFGLLVLSILAPAVVVGVL